MRSLTTLILIGSAFLAVLAGCATSPDPELVSEGREVYLAEGCAACHGRERQGGSMGPDLRRVRRHWSADELAKYLADPASHRQQQARLQRLSRRYAAQMPSFAALPEERRAALAAYLWSR